MARPSHNPTCSPLPLTTLRPSGIATAEFFAGIGLVAEALEPRGFTVAWANDIARTKCDLYLLNRPHLLGNFVLGDVRRVHGDELPQVELASASFPCVDLSLAGNRRGLAGGRSGMLWEFTRILAEMQERRPRVLLIENVPGFASSNGGNDLRGALQRLSSLGYSCDVLSINARHFVPQSRQRMFIVAISGDLPKNAQFGIPPLSDTRPPWVRAVHAANIDLPLHYMELSRLPAGPADMSTVIEHLDASDSRWWDEARTKSFADSLSSGQLARFEDLKARPTMTWRTAYRRTRRGQITWEIRADAIAGCLRTTSGGSSRQALLQIGHGSTRLRWMTPLEYARLMGAGDYKTEILTVNQALFGFGDAVVVDVIAWLADHYLLPTLRPYGQIDHKWD